MPRIKRNFRLRIAFTITVFSLIIVGLFGVKLYFSSWEIEEDHIRQVMAMEMDYLTHYYQERKGSAPGISSNLQSYIIRDLSEEQNLPGYLRGLNDRHHVAYLGNEELRVSVRFIDGVKFLIAYSTSLHEARQQEFIIQIVVSLAAILIPTFLFGYLLSGILTKQMADLVEQIENLATSDGQEFIRIKPEHGEEVVKLARALKHYQNRLTQMLRREQEFTGNISHELRTPITAILTGCELILTDPNLSEKTTTRVKQIETASRRMSEQIQSLLFLAREQALGIMEPVAISECIHDAAELFMQDIKYKKIFFDVDIPSNMTLVLNRQAIYTVLINLLRNAVQYTEKGFIRVTYGKNVLSIGDSGIGIEPEFLPLLFERFFRGSKTGEGFGIGLVIVKRICDYYNWKIKVISVPGNGTTFQILLRPTLPD
ncbi:MAG: HAMP domain-containing sensor histidine kinase [Nitrosomonas sp.]|nr:HAMP domain-containing sensor histidine kinase [Nitrosomonas sp.]